MHPEFGHHCSELLFTSDLFHIPDRQADPNRQAIVEAQVVPMLQKLPKGEAATDPVRRWPSSSRLGYQTAIQTP